MDWQQVFELAAHHRVLPALAAAIQDRPEVPASVRSEISARLASHQRRVLRFCAELSGILACFEQHGVEVICHKGPVLAQHLYGDAAGRDFGDLDFLIRAAHVARARVALQDLGFTPELKVTPAQEQRYLRCGYEYVFDSARQKHLVEVQWQIVPSFYSVDFNMDGLFARSLTSEFDKRRVRVLSGEDLLLVLCVHAAKHQWNQLGMVRDIARLAQLPLDWQTVMLEAIRLRIQRILLVSLLLGRDLLNLRLRSEIDLHADLNDASKLASSFALRMARTETFTPESIIYFRRMVKIREDWRDRVRMAWRLASTPSIGEWQKVTLPEKLSFLYAGVRMARLAKRFATTAAGEPTPRERSTSAIGPRAGATSSRSG